MKITRHLTRLVEYCFPDLKSSAFHLLYRYFQPILAAGFLLMLPFSLVTEISVYQFSYYTRRDGKLFVVFFCSVFSI